LKELKQSKKISEEQEHQATSSSFSTSSNHGLKGN